MTLQKWAIFIIGLISDGGWTAWTAWNRCDVSCGNGSETRVRSCTNPVPRNGGKHCSGSTVDARSCTEAPCPIGTVRHFRFGSDPRSKSKSDLVYSVRKCAFAGVSYFQNIKSTISVYSL